MPLPTSISIWAQTSTETAPTTSRESLIEILIGGGFMMIPLAIAALLTVILIVFYILTIRRGTVVTNRFMNQADSLLRNGDFNGLLAYSGRRHELVAKVTSKTLKFAIDNPASEEAEIKDLAEIEGSRQSAALAQRINWLADIGAIAPMLGLLGTVIGMILAFMTLAQGVVGNLPTLLASGVSQALVTTASGLVIGITAIIFHSLFKGKINRLISEFESASHYVISLMLTQLRQTKKTQAALAAQAAQAAQMAAQQQAVPQVIPQVAPPIQDPTAGYPAMPQTLPAGGDMYTQDS